MSDIVNLAWYDMLEAHQSGVSLPHGIEITDMYPEEGEARLVLPKGLTLRKVEHTNSLSKTNIWRNINGIRDELEGKVHCLWKLPFTLPRPLPLFISGGHPDFAVQLWVDTVEDLQ